MARVLKQHLFAYGRPATMVCLLRHAHYRMEMSPVYDHYLVRRNLRGHVCNAFSLEGDHIPRAQDLAMENPRVVVEFDLPDIAFVHHWCSSCHGNHADVAYPRHGHDWLPPVRVKRTSGLIPDPL